MASMSRDEIMEHCLELAQGQMGGTLATMHAADGTPYPSFVLFHLMEDGSVIFPSDAEAQHSKDMLATPEVAFLVDNRGVIDEDWTAFDRIVLEGQTVRVDRAHRKYGLFLEQISVKNRLAAYFAEQGDLYRILPRRLTLTRALSPERHIVDFEHEDE